MIASSRPLPDPRHAGAPLMVSAVMVATVLVVSLAIARPDVLPLRVTGSPLGFAAAALGVVAVILLGRHPDVALQLSIAVVYLNLSEALVRWHHLPSILQLLAVPLAGVAWMRSTDESRRAAGGTLTLTLLGYCLVLLVSTTYARDREVADFRVIGLGKAFALYLMIVLLFRSRDSIRRGAWTLAGAGALLAGLGVFQAVTGRFDLEFAGLARAEQAQIYGAVFDRRIAGPLGDPNFFAQILLMVVPLALALAWAEASRWRRSVAIGCAGLGLAGIVFTYSRGAALALGAVLGVALLGRRLDRRHLTAALVVPVLLALLPAGFTRRLATIFQVVPGASQETLRTDSSFEERKLWTQVAWDLFLDHPLLGVGAGNYATYYNEYAEAVGSVNREFEETDAVKYPHNLYLEVAAETGLVGAVMFGFVLLAAFANLARARRACVAAGDLRSATLARGTTLALAAYLLSSLFLHGAFPRYLWLLFAFAAAFDGTTRIDIPGSRRTLDRPAPAPRPSGRARRAIAVLLSRFPLVTETFILREIAELERQGQPVRLVPLLREHPTVMHREAEDWLARALFTPFITPAIVAANLRAVARQPRRYCLLLCRLVFGSLRSPNVLVRTLALFPKSVYLAERLYREGVRHVHAHYATHPATVAFVISALSPISISFTGHAHDLVVAWRRPLLAAKLRRARFVRVISAFNRSFLIGLYPWCADKIRVIHMGVDPGVYHTDVRSATGGKREAEPGSEADAARLLCVAALQPYKGIAVLIEACRRLKEAGWRFHCDIVGDGWLRESLEREIGRARLGDRVRLRGARRQDQVAELLRQAAIVVLPSVVARDGQMEGIPVGLMEAMAAERPVVASALSGIPELVDHGVNGLLIEPGNAAALADATATLLGDAALRREMGRRGREKVLGRFRLDACTAALLGELDRHNPPVDGADDALELAGQAGVAGHLLGVRAVHRRRDSHVIEFVAADGRQAHDLVLKTQVSRSGESRSARERASHEYQVLGRLAGCFSRDDAEDDGVALRVPRALAMPGSDTSILMERCRGVPLDELIRSTRWDRNGGGWVSLVRAVGSAGSWLRRLHRQTWRPDAPAAERAWDALVAGAQRDLAAGEGLAVSRRRAAAIWARLLNLRQRLPPAAGLVGCHGDFSPGNIFVTPSSIEVIDFEGFRDGPPWADAAYFLVHLGLYFAYPWRAGCFPRLQAAFLDGYGPPCGSDPLAFELCRTVAALTALCHRSPLPGRGWPHRRRLQRMVAGRFVR